MAPFVDLIPDVCVADLSFITPYRQKSFSSILKRSSEPFDVVDRPATPCEQCEGAAKLQIASQNRNQRLLVAFGAVIHTT